MCIRDSIHSAQEYQDIGLVNIDYSTLTYRNMLPTIRGLQERHIREMLTDGLYDQLLNNADTDTKSKILIEYIIRYLANKSAELYTSQTSHQERNGSGTPEYRPVIRPLYNDTDETGNYFGDQSNYYAGKIYGFISDNAEELGITPTSTAIHFNSKDKKIFTSIS